MLGRKEGTKNELTQWGNFLSLLPPFHFARGSPTFDTPPMLDPADFSLGLAEVPGCFFTLSTAMKVTNCCQNLQTKNTKTN